MEVFFLFVLAEMSVLSHRLTFFCYTNHVADGTMAAAL